MVHRQITNIRDDRNRNKTEPKNSNANRFDSYLEWNQLLCVAYVGNGVRIFVLSLFSIWFWNNQIIITVPSTLPFSISQTIHQMTKVNEEKRRLLIADMIYLSQEINYDSPRGRVAMRTHANEWTTSYLLIHDADINDSGVYICAPTSGSRTSIKVHVFLHGNFCIQHMLIP